MPRRYTYKFASKMVSSIPAARARARARVFTVDVDWLDVGKWFWGVVLF